MKTIGTLAVARVGALVVCLLPASRAGAVVPVLGETPLASAPAGADSPLVKLRIDPNLNGSTVGPTVAFNIYTSNYSVDLSAAPLPSGYASGANHVNNTGHAHVYATYLDDGSTFHQTYVLLGANFPGALQPGQTTLPASLALPMDGRWLIVTEGQYYDHTSRVRSHPQGWGVWDAAVVTVQNSANVLPAARGEDPTTYPSFATVAPAHIDGVPARVAFTPGVNGSTVVGLDQAFQIHTQNIYVDYSAARPWAEYAQGDRVSNKGHINIYGTYLDDGDAFHSTNLFLGASEFSGVSPSQDPTLLANMHFPEYGRWLLAAEIVYNDDTSHVRPHPQVWGTWDFVFVNVAPVPEPGMLVLLAPLAAGLAIGWLRIRRRGRSGDAGAS